MPAELPHEAEHVPMGANLTPDRGGATFRCWAPRATAVWVRGDFNQWQADDSSLLQRQGDYWVGWLPGVQSGQTYKFYVEGQLGDQYKRDPYARELTKLPAYPFCDCIVRDADAYEWSDGDYHPPAFNDLIVYQLHVGTFNGPNRSDRVAKFLDVLGKLDYLRDLGINAVQLLPIIEVASERSRGYEGSDIFSPEMDFGVDPFEIQHYLPWVNELRARFGLAPHIADSLLPQSHQLKAMIELLHLSGIAVLFDIVYNHAGGQIKGQVESLWNFDQVDMHSDDDALYFTKEDWTGPVWALWKAPVRQFLIDNAASFAKEFHVDGFRYDEVSVIVNKNADNGWQFCQDATDTVRYLDPSVIQIAEYWGPDPAIVRPKDQQGAGFDACWHNSIRIAVRDAIQSASYGMQSPVDMGKIAAALWPEGFAQAWRAVHCIENHDEVYAGRQQRIARLADGSDARSWYARSRSRVATGILLTAPGIPMIFMGQEFLEEKQWSDDPRYHLNNLIWWDGLDYGRDAAMVNFHRFTQALCWLRRELPALRGEKLNVFHCCNVNRILAFHRWLEGSGEDVVVVASLNDSNFHGYELGWPAAGSWRERFNSDAYDDYEPAGNAGLVEAWSSPGDNMPATVRLTIPANSILVFSR